MTLVIARDPTPRIPLTYVDHPRTSSMRRLEAFLKWVARRNR